MAVLLLAPCTRSRKQRCDVQAAANDRVYGGVNCLFDSRVEAKHCIIFS